MSTEAMKTRAEDERRSGSKPFNHQYENPNNLVVRSRRDLQKKAAVVRSGERALGSKYSHRGKRRRTMRKEHFSNLLMILLMQMLSMKSLVVAQTLLPSVSASPSTKPSSFPSTVPTASPSSYAPSGAPTKFPTASPSISMKPSRTPSTAPTRLPTITTRPTATTLPSNRPSQLPSPGPTYLPTVRPSISPTQTVGPTSIPSFSVLPSYQPTDSPAPTSSPSLFPTITPRPTNDPSSSPSDYPSTSPSVSPTPYPSFDVESGAVAVFSQRFQVGNDREFSEVEEKNFQSVMESYTYFIADQVVANPTLITTRCLFLFQRLEKGRDLGALLIPKQMLRTMMRTISGQNRNLQTEITNAVSTVVQVDYSLEYKSLNVNVTSFPDRFLALNSNNLADLTKDMQTAGLNITESLDVFQVFKAPSASPSAAPSVTQSRTPSADPTAHPSPSPSAVQTSVPSLSPTPDPFGRPQPTSAPTPATSKNNTAATVIAVVATITVSAAAMLLFFIVCRRRQRNADVFLTSFDAHDQSVNTNVKTSTGSRNQLRVNTVGNLNDPYGSPKSDDNIGGLVSPSDSLLSNKSLLSTGNGFGADSGDEADNTHYLADEFDQYKDQNLEKMRSDIEGTVTGVDGMMSQAMTRALMDDDERHVDRNELYWGGQGDPIEIEATALCEVNDWLKREAGASIEEK
jgi:hypothetical protein